MVPLFVIFWGTTKKAAKCQIALSIGHRVHTAVKARLSWLDLLTLFQWKGRLEEIPRLKPLLFLFPELLLNFLS